MEHSAIQHHHDYCTCPVLIQHHHDYCTCTVLTQHHHDYCTCTVLIQHHHDYCTCPVLIQHHHDYCTCTVLSSYSNTDPKVKMCSLFWKFLNDGYFIRYPPQISVLKLFIRTRAGKDIKQDVFSPHFSASHSILRTVSLQGFKQLVCGTGGLMSPLRCENNVCPFVRLFVRSCDHFFVCQLIT
jgi:hypothetical protein